MNSTQTGRVTGLAGDCYRVVTGPRRAGYVSSEVCLCRATLGRSARQKIGDIVTVAMRNGSWVVTEVDQR